MLVDALLEADANAPRSEAVRDPGRAWTFRQLTTMALVMRNLVRRQTRRRHIGLLLPGGGGFVAALFGALWARKVVVPINFLLSTEELLSVVQDTGIDCVLTVHHFDKTTAQLPVRTICLEDLPLRRRAVMSALRPRPRAPSASDCARAEGSFVRRDYSVGVTMGFASAAAFSGCW